MVTTIRAERKICSHGLAERSDGFSANGHSTTALNTTWPTKRSQVTWATGTRSATTRYLADELSAAKHSVASAISPIAVKRWRRSVAEEAGRRLMAAWFCINLC